MGKVDRSDVVYDEGHAPNPGMTFLEALARLHSMPPMHVSRWAPSPVSGGREMRMLRCTVDGIVYLQIAGIEEQRHLRQSDILAKDWKAHI